MNTPRTDAVEEQQYKFYDGKPGVNVGQASLSRQLETENIRLKQILNAILDAEIIYTGAICESMRKCNLDGVDKFVALAEQALGKSK